MEGDVDLEWTILSQRDIGPILAINLGRSLAPSYQEPIVMCIHSNNSPKLSYSNKDILVAFNPVTSINDESGQSTYGLQSLTISHGSVHSINEFILEIEK
jgi:hypothetical protein